jgi:hypothetical protein
VAESGRVRSEGVPWNSHPSLTGYVAKEPGQANHRHCRTQYRRHVTDNLGTNRDRQERAPQSKAPTTFTWWTLATHERTKDAMEHHYVGKGSDGSLRAVVISSKKPPTYRVRDSRPVRVKSKTCDAGQGLFGLCQRTTGAPSKFKIKCLRASTGALSV